MVNSMLKRLIAVLCAAVMLCAVAAPALAAKVGNISVEIKDDDDKPVVGFEVCIVKVADKNAKLIGDFKAASITPNKLKDEKNNAKNAKKLLAYVDNAVAEKKATAANGRLAYKNLEEGIYLIYDAGNDGHKFDPFLVKMPTVINGSADYDIVASPKIDPITPPGGGGGGGGTPPTPTPTPGDEPTPSPGPSDPVDPSDPPVGPTPPGGGGEGGNQVLGPGQMPDVGIGGGLEVAAQILGVLGAGHRQQGVILGMSHLPACGGQPFHHQLLGFQSRPVQGLQEGPGEGGNVRGGFKIGIFIDKGAERTAAGQAPVELPGVAVQLAPQGGKLLGLGGEVLRGGLPGHLGDLTKLVQHGPLFGLVGVQLQAEGADADVCQTLLHHFQRGHLLRDEQHPLALGQGVGDEGGDGLGFAGAGRAVEDEALALAGGLDGV